MADNGKILKIVGCGCLGLSILGIVPVIFVVIGLFGMLKKSDAYTASLEAVQSHPQVIEALGEPIDAGFFVGGSVNLSNNDGDADLTYDVSGPQGTGTVSVKGTKTAGTWSYEVMEIQIEDGDRINLKANSP